MPAKRRPRASAIASTSNTTTLTITLKDGRAQPLNVAAELRLHPESGDGPPWTARGRQGAVSEFQFDLPPGRYVVEAEAKGFKPCRHAVTVSGGRPVVKDVLMRMSEDPDRREKDEEKGEKDLVDGRFEHFLALRSPATLKALRAPAAAKLTEVARLARATEAFPSDARARALEHSKRMTAAPAATAFAARTDALGQRIDDPVPKSSFGSVGAFVEVKAPRKGTIFTPIVLTIPFEPERAKGIELTTLRMFHIDLKERQFTIVKGSEPHLRAGVVHGTIDRPGIYGVYGLPLLAPVRQTIDLLRTFREQLAAERRAGIDGLQRKICQVILCSPDLGGFGPGTNICDLCLGIDTTFGLPEWQIDPTPPGGPVITPGCNWTCIGPRNINGRVRSLAVHPTDGNILVAGTGTGGVWLTRDAGQSWTPLMHDESSLAIGAVAVHLTDPALPLGDFTIYAGTGEPTSWPGYAGVGVLRSIDSGATWTATGALPAPGNNGFSAIVIDPASLTSNPATTVLYAAGFPGGLYRSPDGGSTWTSLRAGTIQGVALDPAAAGGLYAAHANQGIFRYDPITTTWSAFNAGFPVGFPLLIQIAIGKSAPNTMYAKLDETVYKYNTVTSQWDSLGNHGATTYGYWNNVLEVDPLDSNIVIAGGIVMERTYDGGTTWQGIGGLHSDQHAAAFDSTNHLNIYAGNDGGVYRGTYSSASAIGAWVKTSDGLIVTEYNDVGTSTGPYDVVGGGTQDNGTSRTAGGLTWDSIYGADGGFFVIDPADPHVQYAESQGGGLAKSIDAGASFGGAMSGFPGGPWVTPILLDPTSPVEPNRVLFAGGSSAVYRTTNSAGAWAASSPALGGACLSIALAPSSSAIVYAGTDTGRIWRSSDNGATVGNWVNITNGTGAGSMPLPPRAITDIGVHPTLANTVYITFSGFNASTPAGHVFSGVSTDGGVTWTWTDISSNLPDIPANAIEILPSSPSTQYIGTDAGVFQTTTTGAMWSPFGNGLPSVIISDLALDATANLLRASTYGRGMWQLRLSSPCLDQDVYIRDNKLDTGESIPSPSGVADPTVVGGTVYWWQSCDIKIDAYPYYQVDALFDGVEFDNATHEDPVRNDATHPNPNRLYVQVHNRGPLPAHNVKVKVLYADASAGLPVLPSDFWTSYPNDWSAASGWSTVDPLVPFQTVPTLLPATPKVLRWDWNVPPSANAHTCMLAVITSDEDPVVRSDAAPNDHLPWIVVPNDKHIALHNLHVITAPAPPPFGGLPVPLIAWLMLHNASQNAQFFDLAIDRGALGRADLAVLLPETPTRHDLRELNMPGLKVVRAQQKAWWTPALNTIPRHGLVNAVQVAAGEPDPCGRHPTIPGLLIQPKKPVRIGIAVRPERAAKPGDRAQFSVIQRMGDVVVGGSTYEVRIPPMVVQAERRAK